MKKAVITILLCTALCTTVFAQNESDFKTDGKGTIIGYEGWDKVIVIPEKIGNVAVTAIADKVFERLDLTGLTLPASIKNIGKNAFAKNKLTSLIVGDGVTIGENAFEENQLTSLTVGSGSSISNNAFKKNDNLKTLVLGEGIILGTDVINRHAYYDYMCNNRKAGTYDNTVKYTDKREDDYTFVQTKYGAVITNYNGSLQAVQIPSAIGGTAVKGIGYNTFAFKQTKITRMQLPEGLVFIGEFAFYGNQLTSLTIPNSVTYIGNDAFQENKLTSLTIVNNVTYIGNNAFARNQLTSVTIGNSVTYIGNDAFARNQLTSVTIGNSVTYIGEFAFCYNQLTSVTIGNSVTHIGEYVFSDNQLTSVTIPNSVTYIGRGTFFKNQLTSVTIEANVTVDGGNSFDEAYNNGGKRAGTYTYTQSNRTWTRK